MSAGVIPKLIDTVEKAMRNLCVYRVPDPGKKVLVSQAWNRALGIQQLNFCQPQTTFRANGRAANHYNRPLLDGLE
jgi:hypothetical protein